MKELIYRIFTHEKLEENPQSVYNEITALYSDGYELKGLSATKVNCFFYMDRTISRIKIPYLSFDLELYDENANLKVLSMGLNDFFLHELEEKIKFEIDKWFPGIQIHSIAIRNVRS
jgi:hypothetical protein